MYVKIEVQLTELKMDFTYNPWGMAPDYELEKSSVGDVYQVFVDTEDTAKETDEFIWEQIVDELATMWCIEDMSWKVLTAIWVNEAYCTLQSVPAVGGGTNRHLIGERAS